MISFISQLTQIQQIFKELRVIPNTTAQEQKVCKLLKKWADPNKLHQAKQLSLEEQQTQLLQLIFDMHELYRIYAYYIPDDQQGDSINPVIYEKIGRLSLISVSTFYESFDFYLSDTLWGKAHKYEYKAPLWKNQAFEDSCAIITELDTSNHEPKQTQIYVKDFFLAHPLPTYKELFEYTKQIFDRLEGK